MSGLSNLQRRQKKPGYFSWENLRQRCLNANHPAYKDYGGRGIDVCPTWSSYESFYKDMGPPPKRGYTIERVDVNKGYCKSNCIWIHRSEQNKNTTRTRRFTYKGEEYIGFKALGDACGRQGHVVEKLMRVSSYTLEELFNTEPGKRRSKNV